MLKRLDNENLLFRQNPSGFGYEIVRTEVRKGAYGTSRRPVELLYHTSSKKQVEEIYEQTKAGVLTREQWPKPKNKFTPRLIVCNEKHGEYYYQVNSIAGYHEAMVDIVKQRHKDGWYYDATESYQQELALYKDFTAEEIAALPETLQGTARKQAEKYQEVKKRLDNYLYVREQLQRALKGDGVAAAEFLRENNSDEYNQVELVDFQAIYG